jgi:hypothetical protein
MELWQKIQQLRPSVTDADYINHVIKLRDDSDGRGAYIDSWNHPTETKPTQEELNNV